jgi:hypothetical protein
MSEVSGPEGGHEYDTKTVRVHEREWGQYVYLMMTRFDGEGGILAREGWRGTYVWYSVVSRTEQACVSGADPWALARRHPSDRFPEGNAVRTV